MPAKVFFPIVSRDCGDLPSVSMVVVDSFLAGGISVASGDVANRADAVVDLGAADGLYPENLMVGDCTDELDETLVDVEEIVGAGIGLW